MKLHEGQTLHGIKLLKRIKISGSARNYAAWEVLLSSGHTRIVKEQVLQKLKPNHKLDRDSSNWIFWRYKYGAQSRGYSWEISQQDFKILTKSNCDYCGAPPYNEAKDYTYSGLDRKDNSKGYNLENVVPCCKFCNRIKTDLLTYEEAKAAIAAILKVRSS
jgi:5-methylcytosine-specific restriction endonuclease McrA